MVADNYEDLVKCGYLEMKLPRKHRKFGRQVWKRKWFILRRKSSQGMPRLEYHKSEESCLHTQNKTVVDLKSLIKIEEMSKSRTKMNPSKLVFTDTFICLATDNENNMKEWIRLIKKLVLPETKIITYLLRQPGCFPVTVINTEDSERLNLVGDYLLTVSPEHLLLYRADDQHRRGSAVAQWDLDDIPRFRLQILNQLNDSEKIFIVNLARTSQTVEGEFQFLTQDGREILETVKSHTKQRSRHNDDSPRSTPVGVAASNSSFALDGSRSRSCSGQYNYDSSTSSVKDSSSTSEKISTGDG